MHVPPRIPFPRPQILCFVKVSLNNMTEAHSTYECGRLLPPQSPVHNTIFNPDIKFGPAPGSEPSFIMTFDIASFGVSLHTARRGGVFNLCARFPSAMLGFRHEIMRWRQLTWGRGRAGGLLAEGVGERETWLLYSQGHDGCI